MQQPSFLWVVGLGLNTDAKIKDKENIFKNRNRDNLDSNYSITHILDMVITVSLYYTGLSIARVPRVPGNPSNLKKTTLEPFNAEICVIAD